MAGALSEQHPKLVFVARWPVGVWRGGEEGGLHRWGLGRSVRYEYRPVCTAHDGSILGTDEVAMETLREFR